MQWKIIRLELARTPEFPEGSPDHAYLLRLPLNEKGLINEAAVTFHPHLATVRRTWPGEPDQKGYVVRKPNGWAFSYALGDDDDEAVYHLETHPIALGDYVTLTETDGERLPFRVVGLHPDGAIVQEGIGP
ncbi:MAG: hypothetical protein J7496_01825 [Novosphingobium sp.]|nr:hypothetical protein [Novosphingobium sp.]